MHDLFREGRAVALRHARAVGHGYISVYLVVHRVRGGADEQGVDLPQGERRDRGLGSHDGELTARILIQQVAHISFRRKDA